jgi:hypothetical protein
MSEPIETKDHALSSVGKPKKGYGSPLHQIRRLCLDCADGPKAVRFCTGVDCPLWFHRFGKSPKRVMREEGKGAGDLFDPAWILGKFTKEQGA